MKAIHWLLPFSIAGATCPNYAIWISQDRTPLKETVGRALPDLDFEKLEALNPGYIADSESHMGRVYKIPYDESMTVVPPASWSGNCPKTLVLGSDRKDAETRSWLWQKSIDMRARNHQAVPSAMIIVAGSQEGGDDAKETRTSAATATGTAAGPGATESNSPMHCREKALAVEEFDLSSEKRLDFAETFCTRLKNSTLTPQQPIKAEPYADTFIGITLLNGCPKRVFGVKEVWECYAIMKDINTNCPEFGGTSKASCLLYYFLKRDDHVSSISTPSSSPTP
ncbi:uncharacterized protein FIESC28_05779 [Fusarium coffeatum]|uniref:LysM domain-containing protein n=1 Tax=Fusarium coffeatum TaxID=231269 RepID=A0A366RPB9_9HYPO|nr:uncharacterized protein FIESC28_05779 [Fusarium coffeatum]RBR18957.1 hypothetical protein FIESC28_05779 [Fusarium coffeatum]